MSRPRWLRLGRRASGLPRLKVAAYLLPLVMVAFVLWPLVRHPYTLGIHDWDQMEAHRYLVWKSLVRYHEFPFWNPFGCGGHPAWGGIESDTIVASPWLPVYLVAPLAVAMRVEIFGSALISVVGTWRLASRFTESGPLRALVAIVWALDGRWSMQVCAGHTWVLCYAWMPWVLFFVDRASDPRSPRSPLPDIGWAAACLATMVYTGGIYPVPQLSLVLAAYGVWLTVRDRSTRPLQVVAGSGLLAIAFSAPKLFPILDVMRRFPRLVDSPETLDLGIFVRMLTQREHQDEINWGIGGGRGAWHELGMYIGWPALLCIAAGLVASRGRRERALAWIGFGLVLLAFGSFDPHAPWTLLHRLPVFGSQHVPSRWLYPALLPLACVAVSSGERALGRLGRARTAAEVVLLGFAVWIMLDIGWIGQKTFAASFTHAPAWLPESEGALQTYVRLPQDIPYAEGAYGSKALPAEMLDLGVIDCNTFPGLSVARRNGTARLPGLGAHGKGEAAYRGEAYLAQGPGTATITAFSPDAFTVQIEGARPGDHVVLNQNWDPGWRVDGAPTLAEDDLNSARVASPSQTFRFTYWPRGLTAGLAVLAVALAGLGRLWWRARVSLRRRTA